jgi:hypothetical protein
MNLIAFKEFARVYLGLSGEALQTAVEHGLEALEPSG